MGKLIGEYGLKNKREVWRVKYTLAKIRKAARDLLTLEDKDQRRLFEGNALLRRLVRIGVLDENRMKLDYVLGLKIEDFLERRLQTQVYPSRPCSHQAKTHPCPQTGRECTLIHRSFGQPEAHRLQPQVTLRWWPPWSRQEEERQEGFRW